jgi:hypothetical protein
MAVGVAQTYANHTRLDPLYHALLLPVSAINVGVAVWLLIRNPGLISGWFLVLAVAGVVAVLKLRMYALKAQDRIIRLEERLRLAQVLPERLHGRISELTEPQLIGLRFASDAELPALVEKILSGGMSQKEIKQAIASWRPDYFRV